MKGFVDLEFDLPAALLAELVKVLGGMEGAPLSFEAINDLPDAQGVYVLNHNEKVVYVGKTDAAAGLRRRLLRHARRVLHRKGLTGADVSFRAVRIYVFTAMDLETELIKHYASPEWNNSGFGSNDPGRRRDLTYQKEEGFDSTYPVDIDLPLSVNIPQTTTAQEFLLALREAVPYTVRWERPQPDLNSSISWQAQTRTMRETMVELLRQLPAGWQATVLAGRIILYKEIVDYAFGMTIARST